MLRGPVSELRARLGVPLVPLAPLPPLALLVLFGIERRVRSRSVVGVVAVQHGIAVLHVGGVLGARRHLHSLDGPLAREKENSCVNLSFEKTMQKVFFFNY